MKLILILALSLFVNSVYADNTPTKLNSDELKACATEGKLYATAAKFRALGLSPATLAIALYDMDPTNPSEHIAEVVNVVVAFKELPVDWISGYATGRCVMLAQLKSIANSKQKGPAIKAPGLDDESI